MLDPDNGEDMKSFDIYMTYPENPATRRSALCQCVGFAKGLTGPE